MPTIVFEQDAREAIRRGVSTLARTVRSTLGPRGRNVIIGKPFGPPTVTKDGVTVALEIVLENREQLLLRKARLNGGVAKINVGGATQSEVKQKKMLFDDALNATRAAAEEGVLPGGGVALLRAAQACSPQGISDDEEAGYNIILRACRAPLYWIASNAGQDGGILVERVLDGKGSYGFNALTNKYEDLVATGILDATKVVRSALQSAASVSALLLASGAIISNISKQG